MSQLFPWPCTPPHFPGSPKKAVPLCPVKERTYPAGGPDPEISVIGVVLETSERQILVRKPAVPLGQNALSLLGCSDSSFPFMVPGYWAWWGESGDKLGVSTLWIFQFLLATRDPRWNQGGREKGREKEGKAGSPWGRRALRT